jgi:DNA-binding PadR family transcriptional regulator
MKSETQLETLPSLGETIVLFIIKTNESVSGYRIRKHFMETAKRGLSFGTLVPMLHRFEKAQFVVRKKDYENTPSYNWHLTPLGMKKLESRLALIKNAQRPPVKLSWFICKSNNPGRNGNTRIGSSTRRFQMVDG